MTEDMNGIQFGLASALKTGNQVIDVLLVMCIPIILKLCETLIRYIFDVFNNLIIKLRTILLVSRFIKIKNSFNSSNEQFVNQSGDERNDILQKALKLYIATFIKENPNLSSKLECDINFLTMQNDNCFSNINHQENDQNKNSELKRFSKLQVAVIPTNNTWMKLKSHLWFRYVESESSSRSNGLSNKFQGDPLSGVTTRIISFQFQALAPNGVKRIDDFLQEAIEWYKQKLVTLKNEGHYQYEVSFPEENNFNDDNNNAVASGGRDFARFGCGGRGSGAHRRRVQNKNFSYTRFKLSEEKTFETLFFSEKQNLLSLLDHFKNKTNKYSIKGYPHKLGLLLHGPPGTGKTSLIKAIAEYTKRNIVSINLSQVTTNKCLRDIIFNENYNVPGKDFAIRMNFKDIVFVFEDIDATCSVVTRGRDIYNKKTKKTINLDDNDDGNDSNDDSGNDNKKKRKRKDKFELGDDYEDIPDKLNLAGLLNVLDGTVDTPNRIVIMTTNHPENLDAALTRPGRIDKTIFLGYMFAEQARLLLYHYFKENLDENQFTRLKNILGVGYTNNNKKKQLKDPFSYDCGSSNGTKYSLVL
jgi:chaperone BCS1